MGDEKAVGDYQVFLFSAMKGEPHRLRRDLVFPRGVTLQKAEAEYNGWTRMVSLRDDLRAVILARRDNGKASWHTVRAFCLEAN